MRARRHHWVPAAIAATLVVIVGCRGGKPLGGMVQVTNDPAVKLPDVQAPPQRLASAKSGSPATAERRSSPSAGGRRNAADTTSSLTSTRTGTTQADSSNPSAQASGTAKAADEKKSSATGLAAGSSSADAVMEDIQAALQTTGNAAHQTASTSPEASASESGSRSNAAADQSGKTLAQRAAEKLASLPENERAELLRAFRDSPPEVQQQAMRQLVATAAQDADSTDQPSGIEKALTQSLDDLPELSESTGSDSGQKPTRLAANQNGQDGEEKPSDQGSESSSTAQRITLSDQPSGTSDEADPTDSESESASPPTGSVAQAVGTDSSSDGAVRTASATKPAGGDDDAVAQAAGKSEPSAAESKSGQKPEQLSDQQLYGLLLKRLSQPVEGESEADRSRRKIMARHLMVLSGDPDRAVEKVEGLGTKEQEYLRHQLLGLWTIIDPKGHPVPARRFTTALPQFREATKYLAAATDTLQVGSLAFCTQVFGYGQVEKFTDGRFRAGQEVILYSEVENFTAERIEEGYETHLQGSYDVYDAKDQKVASQLLPADRQVSKNFLRDYYIAYMMHLPQELEPGEYRLQLTMEDVNGKKYGQANIAFQIAK